MQNVEVTLRFGGELDAELFAKLALLLGAKGTVSTATEASAAAPKGRGGKATKAETPVVPVTPAVEAETAADDDFDLDAMLDTNAPAEPAVTKEQLDKLVQEVFQKGKKDALKGLLKEFRIARISDLAEDKYTALHTKLTALLK